MKKKVIAMIIWIVVIIGSATIYSIASNPQPEINTVNIQNQEFKAAAGYTSIEKELTITNDKSNFLINGQVVPEEIRVRPDTSLSVKVNNKSDYPTSVHFHGINGDSNMDGVAGVSQSEIKPGSSFTYQFNLDQPGTYMYHAHVDSAQQVNNQNLYGGLVVEEEVQENRDMLIYNAEIGNVDEHHNANQTFKQVLVNGKKSGSMVVDNDQNIYLNIANLASTPLSINFGHDVKYRITSVDANPVTSEWQSNNSVTVPTAQRFIVEIENPKQSFQISTSLKTKNNATYNIYYKDDNKIKQQDFSGNVSSSMMNNNEFDQLADNSTLIYELVETNDDLPVGQLIPDVKSAMTLDMGNGNWVINDLAYPDTESIDVQEGDVVEVTLTNTSHMAETHPFHLHGHKFQVVTVNGEKLKKDLVLDTIDVEPGNEVTIRFVADNPGVWAFHCHNLVHAGQGMMTTLNYQGYQTGLDQSASE